MSEGNSNNNHSNEAKRLDIRKYPNRRYYDSTRSRHVTLEQINTLIRDGYEIKVTDSKTGQDITPKVLAQIILDLDSPKLGIFPVPLLHRLIRTNETLVNDFVEKYFNQALNAFLDSQRTFEHSVRQAMGLESSVVPGLPDWAKLMWGPFANPLWPGQRTQHSAGPAPTPPPQPAAEPAAEQTPQNLRSEVEELRQQLAALQEQLGQRKAKPRRAGR